MSKDLAAKDFNPSNNELVSEIKNKVNELAELMDQLPAGRLRSIAETHLETSSMFAVKAVFYVDPASTQAG